MASMKLFSFFLCVLALNNFSDGADNAAAPAVDCTNLVMNMADCLSFVSNDSKTTKPEGSCCSGLKTVLKTNADCLCQTFKNSASFGIVLNVTKAFSLPAACKVSAPAVSNCKLSTAPAGSPDLAPKHSPGSSIAPAPVNEETPAPAPAPGKAASSALIISFGSVIGGIGVAFLGSF